MSLASITRIFVFTWQSFWRNVWLSIVTITIVTLAFLSINILVILNATSEAALAAIQDKVDISVYLRPDVTPAQAEELRTFLTALAQVKEVRLTSSEEALAQFRDQHQDDPFILESLGELDENPLGASLAVKANSSDAYPQILEAIEGSQYTRFILDKNFDDHRAYIQTLDAVAGNIRRIGLMTTAVFVLIALLIVFNTVRVALYTHRKEIGIMRLVGATNWFISSPFILESVLYGLVSAFLGIGILFAMFGFIQPYLNQFLGSSQYQLSAYFLDHFWSVFGLEVLVTTLLMVISSFVAIRRYLRV